MINLARCRAILDKMRDDYVVVVKGKIPNPQKHGEVKTGNQFTDNYWDDTFERVAERQIYHPDFQWLCRVVLQGNNEKES